MVDPCIRFNMTDTPELEEKATPAKPEPLRVQAWVAVIKLTAAKPVQFGIGAWLVVGAIIAAKYAGVLAEIVKLVGP